MIRVLVADDHPVVRSGIRQVLSTSVDCIVTGEAADGQETLDAVRHHEFDVVILDITMPGNGVEVLRRLGIEYPDLPVLVLSTHDEDQFAVHLLELGAAGYMTKECATSDLIEAVRKVARGGIYVGAKLAEQLAVEGNRTWGLRELETLSANERAVLSMIARGKTQREIADSLSVNPRTVGSHRARILDKLRLRTNADIVRYAIRNRLID